MTNNMPTTTISIYNCNDKCTDDDDDDGEEKGRETGERPTSK